MADGLSKVRFCGLNSHTCGYCKESVDTDSKEPHGERKSSKSFGVVSDNMSVQTYEKMMLLGWRR